MKQETICIQTKKPDTLLEYLVFLSNMNEEIDGYCEKHHILPKCLGGDNSKQNLILLPIKWHIFVHRLLKEAQVSTKLNWAYYNMVHMHDSGNYLEAREGKAVLMRGESNPNYNTGMYCFYNPEYGLYVGTRNSFSNKYKIPFQRVTAIIKGECEITRGWMCIEDSTKDPQAEYEYRKERTKFGKYNPNHDSTIYTLYHDSHPTETCTLYDLSKKYAISRQQLSCLASGKQDSVHGWRLTKEKKEHSGANHGRSIKEKFWFIHDKYGERYCLPSELSKEFPECKKTISCVTKGRRKSSAGWKLK